VDLMQFKALFLVVTAVLALLVASPALQQALVFPRNEFFTELSLLGPYGQAANYPYNITSGQNYNVFIGIANHLGSCAYYQVKVKFRNETQSAPDNFDHTPSSMPSLYNFNLFVADQESVDVPVIFAFNYSFQNMVRTIYTNVTVPDEHGQNATIEQRSSNVTLLQANFNNLKLNGLDLNLQGYSSDWNSLNNVFYGNLVFELWLYNITLGTFQHNDRFVDLKLNMTSSGTGGTLVG
jgi:hypothetical protein